MNGQRGQAAIEAVVVVPLCIACAFGIAEVGGLLRDRLALSHAAGSAAVAQLQGGDPMVAARQQVPAGLRSSLRVQRRGDRVVVSARPRVRMLRAAGATRIEATAIVTLDGGAA